MQNSGNRLGKRSGRKNGSSSFDRAGRGMGTVRCLDVMAPRLPICSSEQTSSRGRRRFALHPNERGWLHNIQVAGVARCVGQRYEYWPEIAAGALCSSETRAFVSPDPDAHSVPDASGSSGVTCSMRQN
jgi:hypothetical protein